MPRYYFSNTNSDLTGGDDFNKVLSNNTETADSVEVSLIDDATEDSYAYTASTSPGNADWETGAITVNVNITSGNPKVDLQIAVSRISDDGLTVHESTAFTSTQNMNPAATYTFVTESKDWAAGSTTDRLRIDFRFINTQTKVNTVTLETGTIATEVITAISDIAQQDVDVADTITITENTPASIPGESSDITDAFELITTTDVITDVDNNAGDVSNSDATTITESVDVEADIPPQEEGELITVNENVNVTSDLNNNVVDTVTITENVSVNIVILSEVDLNDSFIQGVKLYP